MIANQLLQLAAVQPLLGVPVSIKNNVDNKGQIISCVLRNDNIAQEDAPLVFKFVPFFLNIVDTESQVCFS